MITIWVVWALKGHCMYMWSFLSSDAAREFEETLQWGYDCNGVEKQEIKLY